MKDLIRKEIGRYCRESHLVKQGFIVIEKDFDEMADSISKIVGLVGGITEHRNEINQLFFRKLKTENGYMYNFFNNELQEYNSEWVHVTNK